MLFDGKSWECYSIGVGRTSRRERKRKGGQNKNRMNRTRSETREAGSIADGAQRGNAGQRIHCKGDEQAEICFQVRYRGRGHSRRASAIRAHKVKRTPRTRGAQFQKAYDLLTIIIN